MRFALPISFVILALASASAKASDDGALALGLVSLLCIEQSDQYKLTPLGKQVTSGAQYNAWRSSVNPAQLKCVAEKHIVPDEVCKAVLETPPNGTPTLSPDLLPKLGLLDKRLRQLPTECPAN